MSRAERFRISHSRKIDGADRYVSAAQQAGVIMQTAQSASARHVSLDGSQLLNFGSCSYMALQRRQELREATLAALDEYGTQFHFSRAYLQCPLYQELEDLLQQLAGRPVLVAASTSLAHMAGLPVLVRDRDHMIIDQFAHASLHSAVQLLPSVPLTILRHNRMDLLDDELNRLRDQPGNVWYIADGLYSMLGDFAPFAELQLLLDKHEKLRLYIDDAHSTSWSGRHGRGVALEHFANNERVVVALSLNKAFSAAGGALALPDHDTAQRIRRCGGPMLFSGPIQPPMLGAAVGSARLHLSPGFPVLQAELQERLEFAVSQIRSAGIELSTPATSPIFQAQCDSPRIAFEVAKRMRRYGYYCCICVFPAVPMNRPGIRFTVTRHNNLEDINGFVSALASSLVEAKSGARRRDQAASRQA